MALNRFFLYLFISSFLIGLFFYLYKFTRIIPSEYRLHYYEADTVSINTIKIKVFYFVPKDQKIDTAWEPLIRKALQEIRAFHTKEFKDYSVLKYQLYPTPIRGDKASSFYEGDDTSRGNRNALETILREVTVRVFNEEGDLYEKSFAQKSKNDFVVKVFIYEGVGAAGGHLSVILAKDYLKTTVYGSATLYHEFLHNLGVPDFYDYNTNAPSSDDIMGSGREKPIMETYIRSDIKTALGYKK